MSKKHQQISAFHLVGRFLGYEIEDGYKIKRLQLATANGEHTIKLSKESRVALGRVLRPGEWLEVYGEAKTDADTGATRLKAFVIRPAAPQSLERVTARPSVEVSKAVAKPKTILVCQKSDCMKRGGKDLCPALQAGLRDRGLDGEVTLRGTGCMKQCKAGPNLIMPDKTRYSRLSAQDVPALLDRHFPQSQAEASVPPALVSLR